MNRTLLLGAAVAGLLAAANTAKADSIPKEKLKKMSVVPCYGVNTCKALGQCSGENHGCAAQNECRGQGWVAVPEQACTAIGGSLTPVVAKK
jgi:hypothetical protein